MPRTISDQEYAALMGHKQVSEFIGSIYDDPKLNREAKALIKKKYPHLQIAGYDTEQRVEELLTKEREERLATEQRKAFEERREATRKKYEMTDKGLEDLEKFMVEKNVGDYDVAAQHVINQKPKTIEPGFQQQHFWNHEKAPNFKDIIADPDKWGHDEIMKTLTEQQERERHQRF